MVNNFVNPWGPGGEYWSFNALHNNVLEKKEVKEKNQNENKPSMVLGVKLKLFFKIILLIIVSFLMALFLTLFVQFIFFKGFGVNFLNLIIELKGYKNIDGSMEFDNLRMDALIFNVIPIIWIPIFYYFILKLNNWIKK